MEQRSNGIYLLIGRRETGKTTYTKQLVKVYPQKVLIVDMFSHPSYSEFPRMKIEQLPLWKKGIYRLFGYDAEQIFQALNQKAGDNRIIRNCLVIFEDSKRYIESNVQADLRTLIIEHRNRNIDLVFQFHNLFDVPPYIASMYNKMVMFKINDNMNKRLEKFSNWKELTEAHEKVMKDTIPWSKQIIHLQ